jgi:hypothetical protein
MKKYIRLMLEFLLSFVMIKRPAKPPEKIYICFSSVLLPENLIEGDIYLMQLKEGQTVPITVSPKTKRGNPAGVEPGSATFESSDPSVVSVTQDPGNPLKATLEALDGSNNESVVITFRADGKVGDGVRPIVGTLDVVATQGDAVVVEIQTGEVSDENSDFVEHEENTPAATDPAAGSTDAGSETSGPNEPGHGGNGDLATNQIPDEKGNVLDPDPSLLEAQPSNEPATDEVGPMTFDEAAEKADETETANADESDPFKKDKKRK